MEEELANSGELSDTAPTGSKASELKLNNLAASVYRDCSFRNRVVDLGIGFYDLHQLLSMGVKNDDISSLRVPRGLKVSLYPDKGFKGKPVVLLSDDRCLVDDGLNDEVSSIRIEYSDDPCGRIREVIYNERGRNAFTFHFEHQQVGGYRGHCVANVIQETSSSTETARLTYWDRGLINADKATTKIHINFDEMDRVPGGGPGVPPRLRAEYHYQNDKDGKGQMSLMRSYEEHGSLGDEYDTFDFSRNNYGRKHDVVFKIHKNTYSWFTRKESWVDTGVRLYVVKREL